MLTRDGEARRAPRMCLRRCAYADAGMRPPPPPPPRRPVDPSLYLHRFANRLGVRDKFHAVTNTALRLVAAMKRDWMQTGRRPSGICGAALFISAHIHGARPPCRCCACAGAPHDAGQRRKPRELSRLHAGSSCMCCPSGRQHWCGGLAGGTWAQV